MPVLDIINSIPTSVWSGIFGACLALSGVLITNWSNSNRLKIQLTHDANEKDKERKSKLRHDLYLKAVEEFVKANAVLASLAQIDLTEKVDFTLSDLSMVISKLMLATEDDIAIDASRLAAAYSNLYLKSLEKVIPLQELKIDIKISNNMYTKAETEAQRILNKITSDTEEKNFDEVRRSILNQSYDFHSEQARVQSENNNNSWQSHNLLHLDFIRYLIPQMQDINLKQIELMIKIRKEMGIKSNIDNYAKVLRMQNEEVNKQLHSYLQCLEEKVHLE